MNSSSTKIGLSIILMLMVGSLSCTDENSDARQEERIIKWIDARRYLDVIRLLEPQVESRPRFKSLLAEAYLGDAKFEPFLLAARVMDRQAKGAASLEKLFPHCDTESRSNFDRVPVRCVLKRLIQQLPEAQNPSLVRGLILLKSAYPAPELAPIQYNILMGVVSLGCAVSRLGALLAYYDGLSPDQIGKPEIDHLFNEISKIAEDANQTLERAKYSNNQITSFITGLKSMDLLYHAGNQVQFDPATGLSALIALADPANKDLEANLLKVLIIQNLDRLVEEFKRS